MKQQIFMWAPPVVLAAVAAAPGARADFFRYADTLVEYAQGPGAQPGYTTPEAALGRPTTGHTPETAANNDPTTLAPTVVSLGQRGSLTLAFSAPVPNQSRSPRNPYGYDLLLWGNAFQGGAAVTPELEWGRFMEQGFVEVAEATEGDGPGEWFLILPRIFYDSIERPPRPLPAPRDFAPGELLMPILDPFGGFEASGDLSTSAALFDGFADAVPARGAELQAALDSGLVEDVVLDDPATLAIEGLGGSGIDFSRAVRQSSPGVPAEAPGHYAFRPLRRIHFIRITDARADDQHAGAAGPITTEVDGIIVLPDLRGCHTVPTDADGDGDVDQDDFGAFQACYSGARIANDPSCACFDADGDVDIDLEDFESLRACSRGPAVPALQECAQGGVP